ncbi:hypothetical protein BT69DRAFT_311819 [Atractiella rhizophila]|nr:hypothetical protein BT69DRAFT_311819 [Atractiella rhizophila]
MAPHTPKTWIRIWFFVSSLLVIWDFCYCFLRPHSMEGGALNFLWRPYILYAEVDYVYGWKAYEEKDGFTNAQSSLNVIETILNFAYLYLSSSPLPETRAKALLIGFTSVVMTESKTILYWLQEYFCNYCCVGQNTLFRLIVLWIIPNGLWLIFPAIIAYQFGNEILESLSATGAVTTSSKKKEKKE